MSWIENVRQKPRAEKIKLIWQITIATGLALIAIWVIIGRYDNGAKKNTELFKTIEQGTKDFKLTPPTTK